MARRRQTAETPAITVIARVFRQPRVWGNTSEQSPSLRRYSGSHVSGAIQVSSHCHCEGIQAATCLGQYKSAVTVIAKIFRQPSVWGDTSQQSLSLRGYSGSHGSGVIQVRCGMMPEFAQVSWICSHRMFFIVVLRWEGEVAQQ
ncbi:hypothetical protein SARC_12609 [Sphaeroforma arctica JP610]|uniref:Uncharacterized protein n=1 Tax=Sphaeroforma arctica JP610 TaxID=667725 RepID=A0A0L0FED6_9EUKA|nr:hypothetical protein SARC_12609 [Sphaeroforma arctica JP610]KNC74851.1 hypothetical protein SARC_12609 [Sphaeroforma arctica JP610]|eukprot:XP_014148753.1 hypothetical protein SARC_12609 [Sphaeroforma arctica JP610]